MELLTGEEGTHRRVAAIAKICVACRIYSSVRVERRGAWCSPDRRNVNSQAGRCAIGELIVESGELPVRIPLVVSDEFVEADGRALHRLPINTAIPDIRRVAPILNQQRLSALMDRTKARPFINVLEVAEMNIDYR